jgi:protein-export membrane protein SecD
MYKNLRWKLLTIFAVLVIFGGIGVYPLLAQRYNWPMPGWLQAKALKLGLDLKGGVQLVMRVNTDDALMASTVSTSEQLRDSLKNSNITPTITVTAPTTFRVEGVPQESDAQFRTSSDEITLTNYNRNPLAGGNYEFVMKPLIERDLREQTVEQAMQTIDRRVNELGVTEPTIARYSGKEQLIVQMPGLTDVARAKEIIRSTAILEFRLVEAGPAPKEELLKQFNGTLPGDMEILPGSAGSSPGADASSTFYVVKKIAPVTGQDLRVARPGLDENNLPAVHFELKSAGATKFGKLSGENIGRYLAIVLDKKVVSAPKLEGRITDQGRISGGFTSDRQRSVADAALGRPARRPHLSRGERRRAESRRRFGPRRRDLVARRAVPDHAVLGLVLQTVGRERRHRARCQPHHPARPDGVHRRDDDAPRHRRLRAGDGHGRRLERADLRANQGGAGRTARRTRRDQRRLQPGLPDPPRYARRLADRGGVPVPVRHRPDPRFRDDALNRSLRQPVHLDFRVEDAVRARALQAPDAVDQHLGTLS